jgi:MFS family permease
LRRECAFEHKAGMTVSAVLAPDRPSAARWATSALFLANGFGIGVWATQIPRLKTDLALSDGELSLALLSFALGAIILMPLTGWATAHLGSRRTSILTSLAFAAFLVLPGLAASLPWLVAAALVAGGASGAMDVAMNTHATATERAWGAAIMSSFHGFFSLGGLLGAGAGAALIGGGASVADALLAGGAGAGILTLAALRSLRLAFEAAEGGHGFAWPRRAVLGIGILTFLAMVMEGAVADWSGVYLRDGIGASLTFAPAGFAAFSLAMTLCRFAGDGVVRRLGRTRTLVLGGLVAAIGFALAVGTTSALVTALGFGLVGLGLANAVPVFFSAGSEAGGVAPSVGVAMVATLGYAGFLLGPPAIGFYADWMGLRAALALLVLSALSIALFAKAAGPGKDRR